ncbi:MAG: hypothetical protein ABW104_09090 [Candidatus Thiodiazotropha sp. 6PLUC2]
MPHQKLAENANNHIQPSQFHKYLSKVAWMEQSGIRDGWCVVPPYGLFVV